MNVRFLICATVVSELVCAQTIEVRTAAPVQFPGEVDSNSPAHWKGGRLYVFNSQSVPVRSQGRSQFALAGTRGVQLNQYDHLPMWIEATWVAPDGVIYAWYHYEPGLVCPSNERLTAPQIGALVSIDNGRSFWDFGIVLQSGDPLDCDAQNEYFAGGHGDFSVLPDPDGRYLYFYFGNYGGPAEQQGIAAARMAVEDREAPVGNVWKYYAGAWESPGLGGPVTPVMPVRQTWKAADTDAFWGPSLHWNTYLERYVMLLNHACCSPGWPQEGIYASFGTDLADPAGWTEPVKILEEATFYPQVLGLDADGTDKEAGQTARLYVGGESLWELTFHQSAAPAVISDDVPALRPRATVNKRRRPQYPSSSNRTFPVKLR